MGNRELKRRKELHVQKTRHPAAGCLVFVRVAFHALNSTAILNKKIDRIRAGLISALL